MSCAGITVPAPLEKKKVAVLISGSGTNLQSLIDETQSTKKVSHAEITVVISNKAGVKGLDRARDAGIPTVVVDHTVRSIVLDFCSFSLVLALASAPSHVGCALISPHAHLVLTSCDRDPHWCPACLVLLCMLGTTCMLGTPILRLQAYETRAAFEEVVHATLVEHGIELICLAGFMRVLTKSFVDKWKGRLLNVHPSLLPSFKGTPVRRSLWTAWLCSCFTLDAPSPPRVVCAVGEEAAVLAIVIVPGIC